VLTEIYVIKEFRITQWDDVTQKKIDSFYMKIVFGRYFDNFSRILT